MIELWNYMNEKGNIVQRTIYAPNKPSPERKEETRVILTVGEPIGPLCGPKNPYL